VAMGAVGARLTGGYADCGAEATMPEGCDPSVVGNDLDASIAMVSGLCRRLHGERCKCKL
jgi:hypothetical protein